VTTTRREALPYPFNAATGIELGAGYSEALESGNLVWVQPPHGEPAWLVTRHTEARFVLTDKRFSRAAAFDRDSPRFLPPKVEPTLIQSDPPDHTRLRTLAAKAFTMRRVETLRPKIRALAESLLDDAMATGRTMDLVEAYALPIPITAICDMLGVPEADQPQFRVWNDKAMTYGAVSPEEAKTNLDAMLAYVASLIALRREKPEDDLITALTQARDAGDRLNDRELIDICITILAAGHETTASQIGNFVNLLQQDRQRWEALLADHELIPAAVEELMRYVPLGAGAMFPQYATEDVEVGGTLVRKGEPVLVSTGAANRDPLKFDSPDTIELGREDNSHIGFGHGLHHCLGAPLARLELQEALRALLIKMPSLRIAGEVEWKAQMVARAPRKLPVAW
jgi:cytochrome P450